MMPLARMKDFFVFREKNPQVSTASTILNCNEQYAYSVLGSLPAFDRERSKKITDQ
jgi:hypothetical protein